MSGNHTTETLENVILSKGYFGVVDYVILVLVLVVSLVVGIASGWRRSSTTTEFLTGGKDMNPIAVCLSLLGGVVSAISVQGNATETYLYGTQLWLNLLGCIWGGLIVMFLILPILYPLNLVSVCEYLEMRFQSTVLKKMASLTLIVNSFVYLGVCLYAPSLAFSSAIGMQTFTSLIILGVVCAIYISFGGVRAVVYTDVVQTLTMFVGVLVVVVIVTIDIGGAKKVWDIAEEGGRIEFFNLDPNPFVRHTFWSVQVLGIHFMVSAVGITQAQFQRLASVKSLKISQGLVVSFIIGLIGLWSLFYFSGIVAYAAYADCDPISSKKIEKADQILPYMVGDKLSHLTGMVGIFVAAITGAVLSSLSSQASCMVVLLWEDFLSGWWIFTKVSADTATKITKILSSVMVLVAIFAALLVAQLGTIFQLISSVMGAIKGPYAGIFITSITAPWVNSKGVISGFLVALTINMWLVVGKYYYGGGNSQRLPMSTEGCLEGENLYSLIYNITDYVEDNVSVVLADTTTLQPSENIRVTSNKSDHLRAYDISYCYLGPMGVIIVLFVSSVVSFFTGVVKPSETDHRLVNGFCFRIYSWMYSKITGSTDIGKSCEVQNITPKEKETEIELSEENLSYEIERESPKTENSETQNKKKTHLDENHLSR